MTKMKSKKMSKSTFAIIIMGIIMVAMLAFGGTFAYFTATTNNSTATAKLGTVRISNTSTEKAINKTALLLPGDTVLADSEYTLENKSDVATYVFVAIDVKINDKTDNVTKILDITYPATGWEEVTGHAGVYCRKDASAVGSGSIGLVVKVKADLQDRWEDVTGSETASKKGYMGATISITVTASAIQQKGYEDNVKGAYEAIADQTL